MTNSYHCGIGKWVLHIIRTNYSSLQHWIRRHSCRVIGASPDGQVDFHRFKYPCSSILFLGDERKGLTKSQINLCHRLVRIPMTGKVDSLILGVTGSLLLYELYKCKAN
ncbi:MAG: TrmH family RNA methyltransferase [Cyanobacteria bacterium P01_E01_bin.35]